MGSGWALEDVCGPCGGMIGFSEALGADVDRLGRRPRPPHPAVVRKGGKQVTIPPAPRTARSARSLHRKPSDRPDLRGRAGGRMDCNAADRTVKRLAECVG
jgi:hypothetical protein